jgi:2-dehydro-3-deoxygluconokinase
VISLDVITAGEPMVQFVAQQSGPLEAVQTFSRVSAGAELNVAIGLARLGLTSAYLTRLGRDSFGRFLAEAMQREGIDTRWVGEDATRSTGFMLKSRSDDGSDPRTEYHRRGSAASALDAADLPHDALRAARHLHLTGIFVAVSPSARAFLFALADAARAAGLTVSFDPNLRPSLWPSTEAMVDCLDDLARRADWVLPGLEEGRTLTGRRTPEDIAAHYLERGARGVFVKLGAQGAYWRTRDAEGLESAVPVARVVDTVGAGDGFAVGVISALLEGRTPAQAAARGNAIGARVVQFPGDADGLPTRAQLDAALLQPI